MKKRKRKTRSSLQRLQFHPVMVTWVDACNDAGWRDRENEIVIPLECITVGILIKSRRDVLNIAQSIGENDHTTEVMAIPRVCVKKIRALR